MPAILSKKTSIAQSACFRKAKMFENLRQVVMVRSATCTSGRTPPQRTESGCRLQTSTSQLGANKNDMSHLRVSASWERPKLYTHRGRAYTLTRTRRPEPGGARSVTPSSPCCPGRVRICEGSGGFHCLLFARTHSQWVDQPNAVSEVSGVG